jgi:mRNA-degrading endonuclease RelE of RelBE toxin-antitoxin system
MLAGPVNIWRVRVSDYRIVYTIKDDILLVLVLRIGHRREIYRLALPKLELTADEDENPGT